MRVRLKPAQGPNMGVCDHSNEASSSIKRGKIFPALN